MISGFQNKGGETSLFWTWRSKKAQQTFSGETQRILWPVRRQAVGVNFPEFHRRFLSDEICGKIEPRHLLIENFTLGCSRACLIRIWILELFFFFLSLRCDTLEDWWERHFCARYIPRVRMFSVCALGCLGGRFLTPWEVFLLEVPGEHCHLTRRVVMTPTVHCFLLSLWCKGVGVLKQAYSNDANWNFFGKIDFCIWSRKKQDVSLKTHYGRWIEEQHSRQGGWMCNCN